MPSKKNFRYFRPCPKCGGDMGARSIKELDAKRYCSNQCRANDFKVNRTHEEEMAIQLKRSYSMMNNNPEKYIKHLLQKPARKHIPLKYVMDLLEEQKGLCALSGKEMTFIKKVNSPKVHTNLSIDRIDSTKPYEIGNLQLVCAVTNVMKTTLTMCELVEWCQSIVYTQKG